MTPITVLAPAEDDVTRAARRYERQSPGLGRAFLDAVDQQLERIARFPLSYPQATAHCRRSNVQRFPFYIIYRVRPDGVRVTGVLPAYGDPAQADSRN